MRRSIAFLFALLLLCAPLIAQDEVRDNIALLGHILPIEDTDSTAFSDVWGYAVDGREYAFLGQSFGTYIIDVTDPQAMRVITFIEGPYSLWRDFKTHSHYAYITHDANRNDFPNPGLQIIDLSELPEKATLVNTYTTDFGSGRAHNLYIDNGYAYVCGGSAAAGVLILDLEDPVNPVEINRREDPYWHDVIVKDNIIYGSAIHSRMFQIMDGSDPTDLVLLSETSYPGAFTHNIWMTEDNNYIITTDETRNRPLHFWDVTDKTEPKVMARYSAGLNSVPHNAHILGDFAYVSYYNDGLKILDISNRAAPVEVGHYDTFPLDSLKRNFGLTGNWGAYPFLPSGNILVSDMRTGLYVMGFNNARAGYINGRIIDAHTQKPLAEVTIEQPNRPEYNGFPMVIVEADGRYQFGAKAGAQTIRFSKYAYEDALLEDLQFESGVTLTRDIEMTPLPTAALTVHVRTTAKTPLQDIAVNIVSEAGDFETDLTTDVEGASDASLLLGLYTVSLNAWGYLPKTVTVFLDKPGPMDVNIELIAGYVDRFDDPHIDWTNIDDGSPLTNDWIFTSVSNHGFDPLPEMDWKGDVNGNVMATRTFRGVAEIVSPTFDALRIDAPTLTYRRFYNPEGYERLNVDVQDTFFVDVSNDDGETWVTMESHASADTWWEFAEYTLADFVELTETMRVRFVNSEIPVDGATALSYCMVDHFAILPEALATDVSERFQPAAIETLHFPNPSTGKTTVTWRQSTNAPAVIALFNALGQRVAQYNALANGEIGRYTLDLSDFEPGIYFYRVQAGSDISPARKIALAR